MNKFPIRFCLSVWSNAAAAYEFVQPILQFSNSWNNEKSPTKFSRLEITRVFIKLDNSRQNSRSTFVEWVLDGFHNNRMESSKCDNYTNGLRIRGITLEKYQFRQICETLKKNKILWCHRSFRFYLPRRFFCKRFLNQQKN